MILSDNLGDDDDMELQGRTAEVEERTSLPDGTSDYSTEREKFFFKKLPKHWHSTSSKLDQSDCLLGKFGTMTDSLSVSLILLA